MLIRKYFLELLEIDMIRIDPNMENVTFMREKTRASVAFEAIHRLTESDLFELVANMFKGEEQYRYDYAMVGFQRNYFFWQNIGMIVKILENNRWAGASMIRLEDAVKEVKEKGEWVEL